jgi:xanthine dehydrogenase YagS FAD-binding subunit
MRNFAFDTATSVRQAAAAASLACEAMLAPDGGASDPETTVVKAGGIDLLDLMKEGLVAPRKVTSLSDLANLATIELQSDGGLRIGALVTLARLAADEKARKLYPALADAAGASASPEIRNAATLGGNLLQRPRCWYFRAAEFRCLRKGGGHCFAITGENQHHAIFDNRFCAIVHPSTSATALVALGAEVELVDEDGASRRLALEDFFVGPDKDVQRENDLRPHEILTAVLLPNAASSKMAHLKLSQKQSFDWPLVDVAVALDLGPDGVCRKATIVLGAVAPTPRRARAAEDALAGKVVDAQSAAAAGRAALEGAAPLSKNPYKAPMLEALVRRALLRAAGQG